MIPFITKDHKAVLLDKPKVIMEMADGTPVIVAEYNKNHDPKNGQFTSGPGGSGNVEDESVSGTDLVGGNPSLEDIQALSDELDLTQPNDIADKVNGDPVLNRIYDKQGFNGAPTVVNKRAYQKALDNDTPDIHRGFGTKSHLKQYIEGDHYGGHGLFGSGTYFSEDKSIAKKYSTDGSLMRATWKGNAKVTTYNAMSKLSNKEVARLMQPGISTKNAMAVAGVYGNLGRFAALKGYDAMIVESPFGDSQFVVLNRGKVIIQGDK